MLGILLLSCWLYPSWSMTWFPPLEDVLEAIREEQIDLVGAPTYAPVWASNTAKNGAAVDDPESIDTIDSGYSPINFDRDREPLDEVERIEPRQWPGRPDILPTRSTAPFTTERSLPPRFPQPTTLAQRNPPTQRFLSFFKLYKEKTLVLKYTLVKNIIKIFRLLNDKKSFPSFKSQRYKYATELYFFYLISIRFLF